VVVRDPALVVVLARDVGNGDGLGTGERFSNIDGLLGLLVGAGALSLGEEGLDPGLVDEVESTGESSREEEVKEDDLRVEEAGGGLNDGGRAIMDQDLVEGTIGVRNESLELNANLLRLHVLSEREGKLLLLASGDLNVVLDGRQVTDDAGVTRAVLRKILKSVQRARDEGNLDGVGVLVGDLNDSLGRATVDELYAENVGFREGSLDLGLEGSLGSGIGIRSILDEGRLLVFSFFWCDWSCRATRTWATAPKMWDAARARREALKNILNITYRESRRGDGRWRGKKEEEEGKREAGGDDGIWGNQVPAVGVTIWPQHKDTS
jgi:hypothetical protein